MQFKKTLLYQRGMLHQLSFEIIQQTILTSDCNLDYSFVNHTRYDHLIMLLPFTYLSPTANQHRIRIL